jgi:hydroxymethylpyrimidine/phosphomethylpyrimidine kinase
MTQAFQGRVLVIAGSDSGGGAGIQADIKTITALGGYAATAITAVTVQNTLGVSGVHPIPLEIIAAQARAVLDDIGADAIKTGMLGDVAVVETVAAALDHAKGVRAVIDPVMVAKGGASLLADAAIGAVKSLMIPRAALLTPNAPEAAALTGLTVETTDDLRRAGEADHPDRRNQLRGRADRHPPHPRHRLHPGFGLRCRPGPGSAAGTGRRAGLELCA